MQVLAVVRALFDHCKQCAIYLPPELELELSTFQDLIGQLPASFIVLGDFCAPSPIWGGVVMDERGKFVENMMDINNLSILNDGSKTYNVHTGYSSAIDLIIYSSNIYLYF